MSRRIRAVLAVCLLVLTVPSVAMAAHEPLTADQARALLKSLKFQTGQVHVASANATLDLAQGFSFLNASDAQRVIHDLWDNPPHPEVLGMIVPGTGPKALVADDSYAVVLTYTGDGYVSDKDEAKIDYTALLKKMQKATSDDNAERVKQGYDSMTLVGWAEPPHYDTATHKLYWAKDLAFKGGSVDTLNYDIRVLGRHGYLSLNAIAGMNDLDTVKVGMQDVLGMVSFDQGARYADFNSSTDHVAAYGIAALIAGTLAAKAGLFAKLIAMLLAAKKLIIAGFAAVAAFARKLFGRKNKT